MIKSNGLISIREAIILFFMITLSPAIRLFPQMAAKIAGKAGWLAPFIAVIPMIFLILVINSFFKKNQNANLSDIFFEILGNIIGRIIIVLYLIWILILLALYTRYYSERILSSMLPNTSTFIFIITMLVIVFFASKRGLVTVTRANEIFFFVFIPVFLLSFLFSIPEIKYNNIMNVSYLDIWPICKSSSNVFTVWGYILIIFFFGDKITNKEHIKRYAFRGLALVFISTLLVLIMTIGALGQRLTAHVSLPFFMVVKNISILETLNHIESLLLSVWVISDFIIITAFTIAAATLIKSIFVLSEERYIISPIVIFTGIGALYLFSNRFELEAFSTNIIFPSNIIMEYIIPFVVFTIGKIRKKI